eukprot:500962-Rhodomonas_salina.1
MAVGSSDGELVLGPAPPDRDAPGKHRYLLARTTCDIRCKHGEWCYQAHCNEVISLRNPPSALLQLRGGAGGRGGRKGRAPKGKAGETKARAERIATREAAEQEFVEDVGKGRRLKDDDDGLVRPAVD